MNPRYFPKTAEATLGWLVEEAGEVQTAVGKTIRWGLNSVNPELPDAERETNRDWILRELLDLEAAIAATRVSLGVNAAARAPETVGGEVTVLPDGSGFFTASLPLPKDHWLTQEGFNVPPMPFRCGRGETRSRLIVDIRAAGEYAVRCATMNGKESDFDPDALVQNLVVGMLGYFTDDGLSSDAWANPPEPPKDGENNPWHGEPNPIPSPAGAPGALLLCWSRYDHQTRGAEGEWVPLPKICGLPRGHKGDHGPPVGAPTEAEAPRQSTVFVTPSLPPVTEETRACGGCGERSAAWEGWQKPDAGQCWWVWDACDQMWLFACRKEKP